MLSVKEEILREYVDQDRQIVIDRFPSKWSTGNGLMTTGLFYTLCSLLGDIDDADRDRFEIAVMLCQQDPGVYNRNPDRRDANAHDDVVGVVAASVLMNETFHIDVLTHGKANKFIYNNTEDTRFTRNTLNPTRWQWWSFRLRFPFEILWYYIVNKQLTVLKPLLYLQLMSHKSSDYHAILNMMRFVSVFGPSKRYFTERRKKDIKFAMADYFKSVYHPMYKLMAAFLDTV